MLDFIEGLLDRYERGAVTRRELVGALSMAIVPGARVGARIESRQTGVLRGINLNHVNLQVSNLDRSVDFCRRLFSLPPRREVPGRPFALDLADGLSFLSVPQREPTGVIDHFCVGVEDFEPERVGRALQAAGMDRDLQVARDFVMVSDPDGIRVQIAGPEWDG